MNYGCIVEHVAMRVELDIGELETGGVGVQLVQRVTFAGCEFAVGIELFAELLRCCDGDTAI